MLATAPTHFHRCGQLYYMIMQMEQCRERERPSPTCSRHPTPSPPNPPRPPTVLSMSLSKAWGLGQAHPSLNLFLVLVPASSKKPRFQNSVAKALTWRKIKEMNVLNRFFLDLNMKTSSDFLTWARFPPVVHRGGPENLQWSTEVGQVFSSGFSSGFHQTWAIQVFFSKHGWPTHWRKNRCGPESLETHRWARPFNESL